MGVWGEGSLPCCLLGAVHIDDDPVLPLSIPHPSWRGVEDGVCDQILLKEGAKRLQRGAIKSRKKAGQRCRMRKLCPPKSAM